MWTELRFDQSPTALATNVFDASPHETAAAYPAAMPRQPKRAKSFAFDLLADWSAVASPLGPDDIHRGWVLHGTATLNGATGALAFRAGGYGIAVGSASK
jgi:hypothetical protein